MKPGMCLQWLASGLVFTSVVGGLAGSEPESVTHMRPRLAKLQQGMSTDQVWSVLHLSPLTTWAWGSLRRADFGCDLGSGYTLDISMDDGAMKSANLSVNGRIQESWPSPAPTRGAAVTLAPDNVFKVDRYLEVAVTIQALGREAGFRTLHKLAQERNSETSVFVLCRILFKPSIGSAFRRPRLGGSSFLGGTGYADWPLEPIELVDGVPFLIVQGYTLAGSPETGESYLKYCETNCVWSDFQYAIKTEQQKRGALSKLRNSTKWARPLNEHELAFLTGQIQ